MLRTLTAALLSPWSALPGLVAGLATFALIVWLPNLSLIWSVATGDSMSLAAKGWLPLELARRDRRQLTTLAASLTVAVAVLLASTSPSPPATCTSRLPRRVPVEPPSAASRSPSSASAAPPAA
jgi:hypothetical protein